MNNKITSSRGFAALIIAVITVPALIGYAAAPTAAPPTANVDANFNSVTAGYGSSAPTLGVSGKGVTGAKFENSTATNTVNLGSASAAVDASGPIKANYSGGTAISGTTSYAGLIDAAVKGYSSSTSMGVFGESWNGIGVKGKAGNNYGVMGEATLGTGVYGKGSSGGKFENSDNSTSVFLGAPTAAVDATGIIKNAGLTIATNGDLSDASGAVTVNDSQGMSVTGAANTVNLGNASYAVDAVGIVRNAGLTIAANGDISDASGSVFVNDAQGMEITATDAAKGLIVNNNAGGIWVKSTGGGITVTSQSGGLTVDTGSGTGGMNITSLGGIANDVTKLLPPRAQDDAPVYISDVHGLDVTGKVKTGGEFISTNTNQARFIGGNYGLIHRNDGSDYYILYTASGNQYGSWNSLRPFRINNTSGDVFLGNSALTVKHGGNVGINDISPSYKLDVGGDAQIQGHLRALSIGNQGLSYTLAQSVAIDKGTATVIRSCPAGQQVIACNYRTKYWNSTSGCLASQTNWYAMQVTSYQMSPLWSGQGDCSVTFMNNSTTTTYCGEVEIRCWDFAG